MNDRDELVRAERKKLIAHNLESDFGIARTITEIEGLQGLRCSRWLRSSFSHLPTFMFTPRIATLVMFSTGSLGRVTGALPRWLVVLTFALGIAAFVNVTISSPGLYAVPAWIALVSIVLLVRRPAEGYSELKEEVS